MDELKDFVDNRMVRNKEYFQDNQLTIYCYKFVKNIIDYFYGLSIQYCQGTKTRRSF